MKLIIQIPCLNESQTLEQTIEALPKKIDGISVIETLVIDDGSSDNTSKVAEELGVNYIIRHHKNRGLASAFMSGITESLKNKADIIVNTDADNQYDGSCIKDIVKPILNNDADIVIGARPIETMKDFSDLKKILQKIGSWFVRFISDTDVIDAPSGFRAYSANAAAQLNVFNDYTYTLETIIQAGYKNLKIISIPIKVNRELRPSRLVKSIPSYIRKSLFTMIRISIIYRPFKFFLMPSLIFILIGLFLGLRFIYFLSINDGDGHIQSLILASIFLIVGIQILLIAFLADLISANRKMLEDLKKSLNKKI
jgi:glycosyltransferase involved in cell wall biosynthesis